MIYMLSGITGSGKSSYAKKLKKELNCEVLSTLFLSFSSFMQNNKNIGVKCTDVCVFNQ